jgi:hypothetical protein
MNRMPLLEQTRTSTTATPTLHARRQRFTRGLQEYYIALLDKLNEQLVSKRSGKLSKRILFQENAASHKAATKHQKLADLILKF